MKSGYVQSGLSSFTGVGSAVPGLHTQDPRDTRFRPLPWHLCLAPAACFRSTTSARSFSSSHATSLPYPRLCRIQLSLPIQPANTFTSLSPSIHHLTLIPPLSGVLPHGRLLGKAHKRISPLDHWHSTSLIPASGSDICQKYKISVSGCRYNLSERSFATSRLMRLWSTHQFLWNLSRNKVPLAQAVWSFQLGSKFSIDGWIAVWVLSFYCLILRLSHCISFLLA